MKKHVNYFMIVAFVLIAGFALMGENVLSANAAEQTKEDIKVCENGHTPANEWVIKRYARFNSDGKRVKLCKVCGIAVKCEKIPCQSELSTRSLYVTAKHLNHRFRLRTVMERKFQHLIIR